MKILRAIIISSISIPILIFLIIVVAGLVYLISESVGGREITGSWLGLVYAGATYAYFAGIVSTVPTIILGYPISIFANKYGWLNKKYILLGGAVTGGLFLSISSVLFIEAGDANIFTVCFLSGACGGLFNAYIFFKYLKPNQRLHPTQTRGLQ